MSTDIDGAMRRTRGYWYVDGLTEIGAGGVFLAIGALFAVEVAAGDAGVLGGVSALGLPVVVLLGTWLAGRVVTAAKRRLTFPRTGYVAYPAASPARRSLTAVLGLAVALAVVVLLRLAGDWPALDRATPLLDGVAVAIFLMFMARSALVSRFYLLAALAVALGAAAAAATPDERAGTALFFAAMGLAFVLSGAAVLRRYLRATEAAADSPA